MAMRCAVHDLPRQAALVAILLLVLAPPPPAAAQTAGGVLVLPSITRGVDQRLAAIRRETVDNPDKAIAELTTLLANVEQQKSLGEQIVVLTNRAQREAGAKHFDRAIDDLNKALAISTAYPAPYYFRGLYEMERGNRDAAFADLAKAIELEPRYAAPFALRALIYENIRRYPEALADYDRYVSRRPDDARMRHRYAVALSHSGQKAKALKEIDRLLVKEPDNGFLLAEKAGFLRGIKDDRRALELIDQAIAKGERSAYVALVRGRINFVLGDFAAMEADMARGFDQGLAAGLPNPVTPLYLHVARLRLGRPDADDLGRRQELANSGPWPQALGQYLVDRLSAEALLEQGRAMATDGNAPGYLAQALFFIGERELARGATEAAIRAFQAAVATGATWMPEHELAGRELERLGRS